MKLHLPKALFTALLAACMVQATWAETVPVATDTITFTQGEKMDPGSAGNALGNADKVVALKVANGWIAQGGVIQSDLVVYQLSINGTNNGGYYTFNGDIYSPGDLDAYTPADRTGDKGDIHFFQTDNRTATITFNGSMQNFSGDITVHYAGGTVNLNNHTGSGAVSVGGTLNIANAGPEQYTGDTILIGNSSISAGTLNIKQAAQIAGSVTATNTNISGYTTINGTSNNLGALSLDLSNYTEDGGAILSSTGAISASSLSLKGLDDIIFSWDDGTYAFIQTTDTAATKLSSLLGSSSINYKNNNGTISLVMKSQEWTGGDLNWSSDTISANRIKFSGDTSVSLQENLTPLCVVIDSGVTVSLTGNGHTLSTSIVVDGTLELKSNGVFTATSSIASGINGVLELDAGSGNDINIKGSLIEHFAGTIDVASGKLNIGNDNYDGGGDTNTKFNPSKILIRNGAELYTNLGGPGIQPDITDISKGRNIGADVFVESGAGLKNTDGCVTYSGNVYFNVTNADADELAYNSEGIVQMYTYWDKFMNLSGQVHGEGRVEFRSDSDSSYLALSGDAENPFSGTYALLRNGNSILLAAENAAKNATIELGASNNILKLKQNSTIKSLISAQTSNSVVTTTGTATTLTVTDGSTGFTGTIGENVTLKLTGGTFNVNSGGITNNGTIEIGNTTVKANGAAWNLHGIVNVTGAATVAGDAFFIENDCTLTMQDGSSLIRDTDMGAYQIRGAFVVADGATATLSTIDDIHFNHGQNTTGNTAQFKIGEGASLDLTAKSFQDYTETYNTQSNQAYMEMAANSKLNISCTDFEIQDLRIDAGSKITLNDGSIVKVADLQMNAGSEIILNNGSVLELTSTNNYSLGKITLAEGELRTLTGSRDNRNISIETLEGSGELIGSSWNVIWNIGELNGDGNITWKNNGTHWAPSVFNINGGTFTGTLTANRIQEPNQQNRGSYQSVLQINEGGKNTLAGAVVNLDGEGATGYAMMALNTDQVSIGGLESTVYSHIYAGSATIEGGSNSNSLVAEKPSSTGTSVLNLSAAADYDYKGSVDAGISISKSGAGKQTFSGDMSRFNGSISALAGELAFTASDALSVSSLNVSNVGTLTVEKNAAKGTISTSNATLAGGATVNANLTLSAGATLQMNGVTQDSAVVLDGELTLEKSGDSLITLTGTVLDTLKGLQAPGSGEVVLFTGVDSLVLGGQPYTVGSETLNTGSNVKLSDYFRNDRDIDFDKYYLAFNASTSELTAGLIIPEPTTATLSLLALAGLCARRRRK